MLTTHYTYDEPAAHSSNGIAYSKRRAIIHRDTNI